MDASGVDAGQRLEPSHHRAQRVTVEGIAVQGLGMEHELAAVPVKN
jgi:hypothetical protein